jgi:hypothetical protein
MLKLAMNHTQNPYAMPISRAPAGVGCMLFFFILFLASVVICIGLCARARALSLRLQFVQEPLPARQLILAMYCPPADVVPGT